MIGGITDPLVSRILADAARSSSGSRARRDATDLPVRLVLVAAQPLARMGLVAVFARARYCEVVGEASSADEAVTQVDASQPGVVVVDGDEPGDAVIATTRRLNAANPPRRVIVLASNSEPGQLVEAIHAGARGLLIRQLDAQHLVEAVEVVAADGTYVSPDAGAAIAEWFRAGRPADDPIDRLSDQERRIVLLIAEGMTNRAIATRLSLSEYTVKTYVSSALRKMGFKNRSQVAAAIAQRNPNV
jgi:two-component system response regulator DevR